MVLVFLTLTFFYPHEPPSSPHLRFLIGGWGWVGGGVGVKGQKPAPTFLELVRKMSGQSMRFESIFNLRMSLILSARNDNVTDFKFVKLGRFGFCAPASHGRTCPHPMLDSFVYFFSFSAFFSLDSGWGETLRLSSLS